MCRNILKKKVLIVNTTLVNTRANIFEYSVPDLGFVADAMVVKHIAYDFNGSEALKFIESTIVNGPIGVLHDGHPSDINLMFPLMNFTGNNTFKFTVKDPSGAVNSTSQGNLCMIIEFIQYEPENHKK
jgi:hypothetical protein